MRGQAVTEAVPLAASVVARAAKVSATAASPAGAEEVPAEVWGVVVAVADSSRKESVK